MPRAERAEMRPVNVGAEEQVSYQMGGALSRLLSLLDFM